MESFWFRDTYGVFPTWENVTMRKGKKNRNSRKLSSKIFDQSPIIALA
ncbi:MAG: hypothetical protein ACJAU2_001363 [Maribacter sp.]|jgi:hypothetical protein